VFDDFLFSGTIGIGKYNGGGMLPLPQAIPDDGFFDIGIIQKISKLKVIRSLKSLYDGTYIQLKEVSVFKGKKIIISSPNNIMECDGEYVGESAAEIEIIPGGFRFVC
jgi:diacylglycerol kinase family enzyme